jgi:uncharacterized pyridoxamine 5'-phosphate oxidase family protein
VVTTEGRDDVYEHTPVTELGAFGGEGAVATPWAATRDTLRDAELFWLATVRPDGRPHVTPVLAILLEDVLYFCTGSTERKAKNLAQNSRCTFTTGCNILNGLDVVVEGDASTVNDPPELERVAAAYEAKYGAHFTAPEGTWFGLADAIRGNTVLVFRVPPLTVFGFGKGKVYSQTRYRFNERTGT